MGPARQTLYGPGHKTHRRDDEKADDVEGNGCYDVADADDGMGDGRKGRRLLHIGFL